MADLCITSLIFLSFLPIICLSFSPENPTDRGILVLLDDFALKSSHSIFFKALQNRGFELDFKLADDRQINLQRYGQYMYDGLVLFAPNTQRFGGSLGLADVLNFVDSGHDLILSADVNASNLIRNIAADCGVDFDEHQYKQRGSHTFKFEFENPNTHLRVCHTTVGNVDSGHDLILSADVNASDLIRNIAAECGVDFDEHQYKHRGSHTFKFDLKTITHI